MSWQTVPLEVPPGYVRSGTALKSRGRWHDGDKIRWRDQVMEPIGGESQINALFSGSNEICDMLAFTNRNGEAWLAVAHPSQLIIVKAISPFSSETVSVSVSPGTKISGFQNGEHWSLDNWGGDIIGRVPGSGKPILIDTSKASLSAEALTNISSKDFPNSTGHEFPLVAGLVATPERFVMAYGVENEPSRIIWSTQGLYTYNAETDVSSADWSPSLGDSAGGTYIGMKGEVLAGKRGRGETLFWTTNELISAKYIGLPYYYRFDIVGEATCISRRAMVIEGTRAFWMGRRNFWMYTGAVQRLPCPVGDRVFSELNRSAERKVWCETRDQFGEVIWHYPSGTSTTPDRYVTYNYDLNIWYFGYSNMLGGTDAGIFPNPYGVKGHILYKMEDGTSYLDGKKPFAKTGIIDIAEGQNQMLIDTIIPDFKSLTTGVTEPVEYYVHYSDDPDGTFKSKGPFNPTTRIDLRLLARYIQFEVRHKAGEWRMGLPRMRMQPAGER